jgi:hypothetical protein
MDSRLVEITENIQRVTHTGKKNRFPVMSGTVVSVNTGDMTVEVALTGDGDGAGGSLVNNIANINVTLNNMGGMYAIPSAGADCLVCEVDGPGNKELLKASKYDKIVMQAATLIQLNDGSNGGVPILSKIQDNLKAIHDYIFNTLQPAIQNGLSAVGAGSAADGSTGATAFETAVTGQDIMFENMEDTKVTH